MASLVLNMIFIIFYHGLMELAGHSKSSAQPRSAFKEFQEILRIQTFSGKRLTSRDGQVFDHGVFTNLQCLDICLRTEQCASVDVKEADSKKICRVNLPSQSYYLEKKDNWSHINISGEYLGKVRLNVWKSVWPLSFSQPCTNISVEERNILVDIFGKHYRSIILIANSNYRSGMVRSNEKHFNFKVNFVWKIF